MSFEGPPGLAGGSGQAAGSQAQFAVYLQMFQRLTIAAETQAMSPFKPAIWTTAGDLDVATAYPGLTSGALIINPASLVSMTVTLPGTGGPWIVADGTGTCAGGKTITIAPASGTILGASSLVLSSAWASKLCILAGSNYITLG